MKTPLAKSLAFFVSALTLAACTSSGGGSNNPTNFPTCTAPGQFVAIYPINGSTNVSNGTTNVYIASSVTLGGQYQNVIQQGGGTPYLGPNSGAFSQVSLSQIPTPRAKPGFAGAIYYTAPIGTLSTATWTMYLNNANSLNCIPNQYLKFTTK